MHEFDVHKQELMKYALQRKQDCVIILDGNYRGVGKTITLNGLALELMSIGAKIVTISAQQMQEYYCDHFATPTSLESIKGIGADYVILVDDINENQLHEIKMQFPRNFMYGFARKRLG